MIQNFEDFCRELNTCGFSMGGGNAKGIFALIDYDWLNQDMLDTPVKWHCGDPEVDPWEWRMRVLEERTNIAYSKVFFKSSGFITKDWYPYFYAVRRNGETFESSYERGSISHTAKRIYDIVRDGYVALHEIKALGGFGKEVKSSFDRALVELQMGMFITMTGRKQKKNKYGIEYGCISVPENMRILHNVDFSAALLEQFTDEPYFRLKHDLQNINPVVIPDEFELCTATLADFADHINSCYGGACVTEDELRSYTARKVYCPELWIAIRDIKTGTIAATGIAELDREIGEGILEWIQVSEEYRRCNLGRCIVNELLWRMKDMAKFATVSGQCNNPWKPEKLYRKCGFAGNDIWHVLKRI